MASGRRLIVLLVVVALVGIPAVAIRALCLGNACPKAASGATNVPFCPLPGALRNLIEAGYRQGRSPDVFAVTNGSVPILGGLGTGQDAAAPEWPSVGGATGTQVPIVFSGSGVSKTAKIPDGAGLDDIAPTIAQALGFQRGNEKLRAGAPIPSVAAKGGTTLVVEIAWTGVGTLTPRALVHQTPYLHSLWKSGAGTLAGTTGSMPVDAASSLATMGTGALPSQHGITGTYVRNGRGDLTQAWSASAPHSILATLPDDMVNKTPATLTGMVGTSRSELGLIGGNWWLGERRPLTAFGPVSSETSSAQKMLAHGFGSDSTPDVIGIALGGSLAHLDAATHSIVTAAEQQARLPDSVMVVVAGTGSGPLSAQVASTARSTPMTATQVTDQVDSASGAQVVQDAVPGALFLDQQVLADKGVSPGKITDAFAGVKTPPPAPKSIMNQAFPAFSITFARYC